MLSLLVVLLGGLLAFAGAQELTHHTLVLAVARNVPVGGTITDQDLVTASVNSDPNLSPVPASQRSRVVGRVAQVALVKGELLTAGQIGTGPGFTPGQVLVALPLKQGQFPGQGLTAGEKVLIVATPGSGASAPGAGAAGASSSQSAGTAAVVASVAGEDPATQVTVVDVRVGSDAGAGVAQLASTGNLALILLPTGG